MGFGKLRLILGCCFLVAAAVRLCAQEKEMQWNVTYRGTEMPKMPWATQYDIPLENITNCVAEVKDGALLIADRGTDNGQYLFFAYPWAVRPEDETIAEAKMKLRSGGCGIVVCNGISTEVFEFYPDRIRAQYSNLTCKMNTMNGFHVYRVVIKDNDFKLYVDGELKLDGKGKYNEVMEYEGRNALGFGAASSAGLGEVLWEYVRWTTIPQAGNKTRKTASTSDPRKTEELKITIAEPLVVAQAPVGEKRWGYWQFPGLSDTQPAISIDFSICEDSMSAYGTGQTSYPSHFVLDGNTWKLPTGKSSGGGLLLPNGDRLSHHVPPSLKVADLKLPEPVGQWIKTYGAKITLYRAKDLPPELANMRFSRYCKDTDKWVTEIADVNERLGIRIAYNDLFPLFGGNWFNMKVAPDNSVMLAKTGYYIYFPRQDLGAERFSRVIFLRSTDNGRKWRTPGAITQGTIPYVPDTDADPMAMLRDGFEEPGFEFAEDGTMVCFIRTDDGVGVGPLYVSRSQDMGKNWSKPKVFNPYGVKPMLLTLKNGVMVLAYGRPGVEVRFSGDNGWTWTEPYKLVPLTSSNRMVDSCGYTSLLATGDDKFLIAYSNFRYKGSDGLERKTILTREITIQRGGKPDGNFWRPFWQRLTGKKLAR
ncbi:MAG: sialidase family protein [Kiritimatiellaeota bacterium]|nr:sialidase family protein [Kiritimatiellota bacterium]